MEFKRLPDYPRYRIYKNGDVYREHNKTERLKQPTLSKGGYYYVNLCQNRKSKSFLIHRLIAILFIPNPDLKKEVDHINRVKTDNRIENLRWLDRSGQNLNRDFKENNTGFQFIVKRKNTHCKSGFSFQCQIRRNQKCILNLQRVKLEEAIEIVRTFLLQNEWVLENYDRDKINKIKEMYNIS
tara:strand:- start:50 stop:598 length:549 start_codon:yes stop_codon:yes gene_type:complete